MRGASIALTAMFMAGLATPVVANTIVSIVHVQESAVARALWDRIAKDYEAEHKGVTVQFKYTPGESYKEKLPTELQSDSRPDIVYSWGGGVMDAQNQAGFLKDITAESAPFEANLAQTAVDAFKVDGKTVGVPFDTGLVGFYYNKDLLKKAGVNAEAIKTWDDFLGAVKALKAAGITPIINGTGDKWPMHFYYSYLIMRIGGENALTDAKAGKNGGFKNSTFVEAGKRLRDLAALEPFQAGHLTTKYSEAAGMFGDGKGAMQLMFELLPVMQGPSSSNGKGLPEDDIGIFAFPTIPGGKGKATDTLGGVHGFLVTKSAPPEAVDFLKFFSQEKYAKEAAASGGYIPIYKGTAAAITDPLFRQVAEILAQTTYHQNFLDQDLGPSVGRVINDVSVSVAEGKITPEAAAAAIQEAADQQ
jgi:raffinose/stachyose/melibiose transport system substrate-binding protein